MDEMRNGTLDYEQTETNAHQRSTATSEGRTLGLNFRADAQTDTINQTKTAQHPNTMKQQKRIACKSTGYHGEANRDPQGLESERKKPPRAPMPDTCPTAAPSRVHNESAEPTPAMRPAPAPQMPFYYGPPGQGPSFSIDMIKLMTSIVFNLEHPQTILEAFAQRHWGAHVSIILHQKS
jgi:hypothetical protein